MQTPKPQWTEWANTLQRLKLDALTAWLLEAGAPVALLGAQALFVAAPILGPRSDALARLLEDAEETRAFVHFLREESPSA
ncbi:MAG: hypothetical protein HFACDABA_02774 [Anaerolineales bacterium]|nr:hypothetical protein [Anaerolineales bacterium]